MEQPFVVHGRYACFYHGPFSQWHPGPFVLDDVEYSCAEQAMMHAKAVLFGDLSTAERIMKAKTPAEQKRLGRQVAGFDPAVWDRECIGIVARNNVAKFSQDPGLLDLILSTGDLTLVECSPTDRVWGIGRGLDWHRLADSGTWRGENRLGQALVLARQELSQKADKRFSIAATGHRPNKLYGYDLREPRWVALAHKMRRFLKDMLAQHGKLRCISGMALGVDQLFALVALKLRDEGADIVVTSALPCRNQNTVWRSDEYWRDIMQRADEHVFVHDGPYTQSCLQERNEWMVDRADLVMAVFNGTPGGTANCIRYAEKRGVRVENILPEKPCKKETGKPVSLTLPGMR